MKYGRAVLYCIATGVIYVGLCIFGWGLDDLAGFFALAPRFGYAVVGLAFALAIGYQAIDAPEGIDGGKGEDSKRIRRQTPVAAVMTLVLFGALVLLPFADRREIGLLTDAQTLRWAGLAICALGYALVFWSGLALGKQYSAEVTIQKDHQLVTSGPYHAIRHPRYLGVIALAIGLPLVFHSWPGLMACAVILGLLLLRIKDEEQLMHAEFGPAWERYCQESWRLLPYLY